MPYRNVTDKFILKYLLTNECNYRCEYCSLAFKDKDRITYNELKNTAKIVKDIYYDKNKGIVISMFGGEPTFNDIFLDFSKYIIDLFKYKIEYKLVTNFTNTKKIYELIDFCKDKDIFLNIAFSYHGEYLNYDIKKFIKKVDELHEYIEKNNIKNVIKINFMIEKNKKIIENFEYLQHMQRPYKIFIYKLDNESYDGVFDYDFIKSQSNQKYEVVQNISQNYKNYRCEGLIKSIYIDYKGNFFPNDDCCVVDAKPFGNFKNIKDVETLKKWYKLGYILCPYDKCLNCASNIRKFKGLK